MSQLWIDESHEQTLKRPTQLAVFFYSYWTCGIVRCMSARIVFTGVSMLLLCACVGYYFFMNDTTDVLNYPPKEGPIVAFGDSLVVGVGSPETEGFVGLLSEMIGEPIINEGVRGDTTADGLVRIPSVLVQEPRIVLLLLGGNDYLRRVPKEETFENIRTIITALQARGAIVVLLGIRGGLLTDGYDEDFEALARETKSPYVPNVLDGIFGNPELMFDSIHPNREGYERIAKKIYSVLKEVVR